MEDVNDAGAQFVCAPIFSVIMNLYRERLVRSVKDIFQIPLRKRNSIRMGSLHGEAGRSSRARRFNVAQRRHVTTVRTLSNPIRLAR